MMLSDYWGALSLRQRVGFGVGTVVVGTLLAIAAIWLARDPFVPLAGRLEPVRLALLTQELDRSKVAYRIIDDGNGVEVRQSTVGAARAVAGGGYATPPGMGLELFNETDFSSTDFAQKVNYQRALQGELMRTIQGIAGVRGARVHVLLPEGGVFKRSAARGSAAVTLSMVPGRTLHASHVRGIQRLVAASVPQIKADEVVVLDESGTTLSRVAGEGGEGDLSTSQLELKRQADQYLQGKLERLLEEVVPQGTVSASVDTLLDYKQLRVTSEEPIAAHPPTDHEHATGVLVKERQSQRGRAAGSREAAAGDATDPGSAESEYEYKVGHRVEQTLISPGSIKRISVAVAVHGAPADLTDVAVEQLVAHAVGVDRARGDSVAIMLLPGGLTRGVEDVGGAPQLTDDLAPPLDVSAEREDDQTKARNHLFAAAAVVAAALVLFLVHAWLGSSRTRARPPTDADVEALAAKVRAWIK